MTQNFLEIKNLYVEIEGKEILKGLNLNLEKGKVHVLMGPNGSGKSTLAYVLMGHPKYKIISGNIIYNGEDITKLSSNERSKKGIFLSFQYPIEVSGVTLSNFLRSAYANLNEKKLLRSEFRELLEKNALELGVDKDFLSRYLNQGFSGGEKKKAEILQMLVLNPKMIVLDETDSGLDIDSLRIVAKGVNSVMNKDKCSLVITHYKRILNYIKPDRVSVMIDGKIALDGGPDLVDSLEEKGYGWIEKD